MVSVADGAEAAADVFGADVDDPSADTDGAVGAHGGRGDGDVRFRRAWRDRFGRRGGRDGGAVAFGGSEFSAGGGSSIVVEVLGEGVELGLEFGDRTGEGLAVEPALPV